MLSFSYLFWIMFECKEDGINEHEPADHSDDDKAIAKCWFIEIKNLAIKLNIINKSLNYHLNPRIYIEEFGPSQTGLKTTHHLK